MTVDPDRRPPETPEELAVGIRLLFKQAHGNGVDVTGGWDCRNGDRYPDWDVVVTELRKPDHDE
ncbi:hypothetical protein [Natronomonas sp.]|uniref:hypothetical protein n=1 Tax=Natronomonas sp. TaxID=2184060 RepID=UPI00261692C9|nr:hypothetical protein [Natronomonas sp.]